MTWNSDRPDEGMPTMTEAELFYAHGLRGNSR